jgi:small subunit ribosomal protein S1
MSYKRVNHPNEVINIGDTVKVQIIRINRTPSASRSA